MEKKSVTTVEQTENVETEAVEVKKVRKTPAKKTTKTKSSKVQEFLGTGKRKSSVARVRISVGTGKFIVNDKNLEEYFDLDTLIAIAKSPLVLTNTSSEVDVKVNVYGGGISGQAGAIRHGVTRALMLYRPELRPELKKAGYVTRDARIKERKKYGLKKARKAPQFSKR